MNETRDLIIGIDLRNDSSQLCYYDRNADEPRSLPVKVGSSQYEVPTCLCRRVEQKDYCIGIEAEYFAREKEDFLTKTSVEYLKAGILCRWQERKSSHGRSLHIFWKECLNSPVLQR